MSVLSSVLPFSDGLKETAPRQGRWCASSTLSAVKKRNKLRATQRRNSILRLLLGKSRYFRVTCPSPVCSVRFFQLALQIFSRSIGEHVVDAQARCFGNNRLVESQTFYESGSVLTYANGGPMSTEQVLGEIKTIEIEIGPAPNGSQTLPSIFRNRLCCRATSARVREVG